LCLLGRIASHAKCFDPKNAESHYVESLVLAEPRAMRPLVAHCHAGLAKLYRGTGERERAGDHLSTATDLYRAMEMTYWLNELETETKVMG
jgi:hypothetical protein